MNIEKLKISANTSISQALSVIGLERVRLGVVVNDKDEVIGVIHDSDIRKALINGASLSQSIEEIYNKNPITLTPKTKKEKILKLAYEKDIYDFPVLDENKKLIEIKSVAKILANQTLQNPVIIMAGGLGSRLKELTKDTPKPMLKVGKKPILETIIKRLFLQKFENFILCVNYKRKAIEDYFKDGEEFGVKISYIKEEKKLGTAGALSLIKQEFNDTLLLMNADILTDLDFSEFLNAHKKSGAALSVCVREYEHQIPYGVITQKNNFIEKIEEKPKQKCLVSAGIYAFEPCVLKLLKYNEYLDMPDLINLVMKKFKVNTFVLRDYWIDIGRLDDFQRANEEF